MKRLHTTWILLFLTFLASVSADPSKVGIANYAKIQRGYFKTEVEKRALDELRIEEEAKLAESVQRGKEMVDLQRTAQGLLNDPTLSRQRKDLIQAEIEQRNAEIRKLQTLLQNRTEVSRRAAQVQTTLLSDISNAVREIAEAKGLHFVHNTGFGIEGVPALGYFAPDQVTDITAEVLAKLNEKAPEGWKPREPATATP